LPAKRSSRSPKDLPNNASKVAKSGVSKNSDVPTSPEHNRPHLHRPKSAVTLSNGAHRSTHKNSRVTGQAVAGSKGPARPVTAEGINHMRFDANHPINGVDGQPLSPRRSRQPLAWQFAKLPTYDGAKSPYGLSAKQLEERERLVQ
jgi:hypothetical protein